MLEFHRDADGAPRARAGEGRDHLAGWLESDVQENAALGRKILAAADKVAAGDLDEWERTGNVYTLTLSPEGADLRLELDDVEGEAAPLHLPLAELRDAVARWVGFVDEDQRVFGGGRRGDGAPPEPARSGGRGAGRRASLDHGAEGPQVGARAARLAADLLGRIVGRFRCARARLLWRTACNSFRPRVGL